ncbi:Mu-like prophage major head subunit gpT family protein [Amaricoccus sp.]|uniref:Mu-like prophage major head subunit gpT family protein n=1 Tax=Amaricoccus sp. TaxID=1872485 RepID=UPI001B4944E7|nr:Mu-like prophage major head subunit gpT family protein [Amaricoccus sp.]MBP7003759.1 Mu-like prophage major head subunit gpT family protein [Amaricoccus sp.]
MILNPEALDLAFKGFKSVYTDAYTKAPVAWNKIAMTVPSSARDETYGWLGQFPQLREWVSGERELKALEAFGFTIVNRRFEATVSITRSDFADDRLGVFKPMFAEMGHNARQHPDELIFGLLNAGFSSPCYDGQNFFDAEHPVPDPAGPVTIDGRTFRLVSNMQAGTGPAWFLFDTSRAVRSIIWQEREEYEFQTVNRHDETRVFMTDEYLYGIRARANAGFGLWQLAFGSKAALTAASYAAARAAMSGLKGDKGRILGIRPTVLVVPPTLEEAALKLLNAETNDGGGSNPWKGTAEIIVSPWLSGEGDPAPETPEEEE